MAMPPITPAMPSKRPPEGTESLCEPTRIVRFEAMFAVTPADQVARGIDVRDQTRFAHALGEPGAALVIERRERPSGVRPIGLGDGAERHDVVPQSLGVDRRASASPRASPAIRSRPQEAAVTRLVHDAAAVEYQLARGRRSRRRGCAFRVRRMSSIAPPTGSSRHRTRSGPARPPRCPRRAPIVERTLAIAQQEMARRSLAQHSHDHGRRHPALLAARPERRQQSLQAGAAGGVLENVRIRFALEPPRRRDPTRRSCSARRRCASTTDRPRTAAEPADSA